MITKNLTRAQKIELLKAIQAGDKEALLAITNPETAMVYMNFGGGWNVGKGKLLTDDEFGIFMEGKKHRGDLSLQI